MAGNAHALDLGDDGLLPAWQSVIALSEVMDTSELTIIGGLMVYLHARRGGIEMPRSTNDADFLVNVIVNGGSLTAFAAAVRQIGFELKRDERYAYRFVHADGRKVDVMVADHLPSRTLPRLSRLPALEVDGGQQAIDRRDSYTLRFTATEVAVGVPDEIGALVAKGAAYLIDPRNPGRHLDDGATLLASITDASELDYSRSTQGDRRRLGAIKAKLADSTSVHWVNLSVDARARGQMNLALVTAAMRAE
jgi:hypothetical protein